MPAIITAKHCDQNTLHSAWLEGKHQRESPESTALCERVSTQQTHEGWRSEPCLKHSLIDRSACTLHRNRTECNWSKRRTSQRPRIDFHVSVMATRRFRLTCLHYSIAPFKPFMSCLEPRFFTASQRDRFAALTHFHLYNFRNYSSSWNNWETMICIYIRSLDQARGLLAQGTLVFPSAVSSDSQHVSSGSLCTACVRQLSLSTSKLSGTSHSLSLHPFFLSYHVSYLCLT